jgi:hypothetical protein
LPGIWRFGSPSVTGVGCHWQSLIISPQQLAWMMPPQVSGDPRFQWWKCLREVPSDWVSSRGEAERFLYYDGPTRGLAPIWVKLDEANHKLLFLERPIDEPNQRSDESLLRRPPLISCAAPKNLPDREGIYIEVHGGVITGLRVAVDGKATLPAVLPLRGDAVAAEFRKMIVDYGLTEPEADGLIATWSPWLFHAEGKRFILRMSAADYDRQCPMRVRPAPTEVVRLGLVLSEFGPDATQPATQPTTNGAADGVRAGE